MNSSTFGFVVCLATIGSIAGSAKGQEEVVRVLDKRSRLDQDQYFLVFCSRKSEGLGPGHAFVAWGMRDQEQGRSLESAFGFYPKVDESGVKAALGPVPGEVANEATKDATKPSNLTARLIVKVDKDEYLRAREVLEDWRIRDFNNYELLSNNCIQFVKDVANAIELETPSSTVKSPSSFVLEIVQMNGERH